MNNPVNTADSRGNWPRWITGVVAIVATVIAIAASAPAAGVVAATATIAYAVQSVHYDDRTEKNTGIPLTYREAMSTPGADNSISAACHQFTAKDGSNTKVCWPNGKEGIYDSDGNLVTNPKDIGTYNYSVPIDTWSSVKHGVLDVAPWVIFGNNDNDPGPIINYFISLFK